MAICPHIQKEKDPTPFWDSDGVNFEAHRVGWAFAGICTLLACVIAFFLIIKHLQYYTKPEHQRHIVRICLMVPVYSITSWLSYRFYHQSAYFILARDCYEAFVLASFFILLLQYLGETTEEQKLVIRKRSAMKFAFPLCFWKYNPAGTHFLQFIKWGILQYVVVRPITTILAVIFESQHILCEVSYSPAFANLYIQAVNFISVSISMYCLITLYITIKDDLVEHKPFLKFLCVKLVVFFCFWQSVMLGLLISFGFIKETVYWTENNISTGINAILTDFEMIIFGLLHIKAFGYRMYRPVDRKKGSIWSSLVDSLNPADFGREIWAGVIYGYNWMTGRPLGPRNRYYDLELALGTKRSPIQNMDTDDIMMESYNKHKVSKDPQSSITGPSMQSLNYDRSTRKAGQHEVSMDNTTGMSSLDYSVPKSIHPREISGGDISGIPPKLSLITSINNDPFATPVPSPRSGSLPSPQQNSPSSTRFQPLPPFQFQPTHSSTSPTHQHGLSSAPTIPSSSTISFQHQNFPHGHDGDHNYEDGNTRSTPSIYPSYESAPPGHQPSLYPSPTRQQSPRDPHASSAFEGDSSSNQHRPVDKEGDERSKEFKYHVYD